MDTVLSTITNFIPNTANLISKLFGGGQKPVDYEANLNSFLTAAREHYQPTSWIKSIGGQSSPEGQEFIRWIENDFIPNQANTKRLGEAGQDPDWNLLQQKFASLETEYAARLKKESETSPIINTLTNLDLNTNAQATLQDLAKLFTGSSSTNNNYTYIVIAVVAVLAIILLTKK